MVEITEIEDDRSVQINNRSSAAHPSPRESLCRDLVSASASTPVLRLASRGSFPTATAITHIQDTTYIAEVTKKAGIAALERTTRAYSDRIRDLLNPLYAADEVTMSAARRAEQIHSTFIAETPGFLRPMLKLQNAAGTWLGARHYFWKNNHHPGDETLTVLPQEEEEFTTAYVGGTNARVGGWRAFSIHPHLPDGHGLRFPLLRASESKGTANCEPIYRGSNGGCYPTEEAALRTGGDGNVCDCTSEKNSSCDLGNPIGSEAEFIEVVEGRWKENQKRVAAEKDFPKEAEGEELKDNKTESDNSRVSTVNDNPRKKRVNQIPTWTTGKRLRLNTTQAPDDSERHHTDYGATAEEGDPHIAEENRSEPSPPVSELEHLECAATEEQGDRAREEENTTKTSAPPEPTAHNAYIQAQTKRNRAERVRSDKSSYTAVEIKFEATDAEQGHNRRSCAAKRASKTNHGNIPHAQGQTSDKLEEDTTPAPPRPKSAGKNKCTAAYPVRATSFYMNETNAGAKTTARKTKPGARAGGSSKMLSTTEAGANTTNINTLTTYIADADDDVLITGATRSSTSAEAQAFRRQLRQNKRRSNKERKIALTHSAAHSWPPRK